MRAILAAFVAVLLAFAAGLTPAEAQTRQASAEPLFFERPANTNPRCIVLGVSNGTSLQINGNLLTVRGDCNHRPDTIRVQVRGNRIHANGQNWCASAVGDRVRLNQC
jgi:hypothetical protein